MGIVVDIIVAVIIGLCIFLGYKRGLSKCLFKLATTLIAIFIAILVFRPFVDFVVRSTIIDENIQLSIEKVMNNGIEENGEEKDRNIVKEDSGIPKPVAEYINTNFKDTANERREEAVSSVARGATLLIVNVACFIAIYVLVKIVLQIFAIIIDVMTKLPVIKQCNEVGGIIFGTLQGVFIVLIVMTIIAIIAPLTGAYEVANVVSQSHLGSFFYNNNIILNIIF